jgi:predicted DNA-binding WGR domain protein
MASVVLREYLTYVFGGSRKHYFVWIRLDTNHEVWTAWGAIGTNPQVKLVGSFSTNLQAQRTAAAVINGKISKGYVRAPMPTKIPVPPTWETGNIEDSVGPPHPLRTLLTEKFAPVAPTRALPPKKTDAEKMAEAMAARVSKWGF